MQFSFVVALAAPLHVPTNRYERNWLFIVTKETTQENRVKRFLAGMPWVLRCGIM